MGTWVFEYLLIGHLRIWHLGDWEFGYIEPSVHWDLGIFEHRYVHWDLGIFEHRYVHWEFGYISLVGY